MGSQVLSEKEAVPIPCNLEPSVSVLTHEATHTHTLTHTHTHTHTLHKVPIAHQSSPIIF